MGDAAGLPSLMTRIWEVLGRESFTWSCLRGIFARGPTLKFKVTGLAATAPGTLGGPNPPTQRYPRMAIWLSIHVALSPATCVVSSPARRLALPNKLSEQNHHVVGAGDWSRGKVLRFYGRRGGVHAEIASKGPLAPWLGQFWPLST